MMKVAKTLLAFVVFFVTYRIVVSIALPIVMFFRNDPGWMLYPASLFVAAVTSLMGVAIARLLFDKFFDNIHSRGVAALFIGTEVVFILFGIVIYGLSIQRGIPIDGVFLEGIVPSVHSLVAIFATIHLLWNRRDLA
jgi:hypothetical protein